MTIKNYLNQYSKLEMATEVYVFHTIILLQILCISHCFIGKELLSEFKGFVERFNRRYYNDSQEYEKRYKIFRESVSLSQTLNRGQKNDSHPVYGVTKFSDLSPQEFKKLYLEDLLSPMSKENKKTPKERLKNLSIPQKVDWRTKGIISNIKDQKSCGACWAFASVETVESMYAKEKTSKVPDLSVQEVIDCSSDNDGCLGGDTCTALEWLEKDYPLVDGDSYPLTDKTETCHVISPKYHGVQVANSTCMHYVGHEDEMLTALATIGPLTVTVDATTWNNYIGGVIQYHCSNFNNHAVQIVGYDLTGDVPYYIVRNSWGVDFGDKGFLYIKIGENLCGIASRVSSVMVK